eukprot:CAMPEP_0177770924 /NCGR_PEP_ID=MMETSP0491_2-20121128/11236_1 /TAXON_ID=63592 /ORGANISM="Tetraselmis chuii, Strain PLY429" /LENGTH=136 /DNA_ID=CAMNT_0019288275 /DNA_START=767 /DNA_END=1177 /DNA_ORIENTATION=-
MQRLSIPLRVMGSILQPILSSVASSTSGSDRWKWFSSNKYADVCCSLASAISKGITSPPYSQIKVPAVIRSLQRTPQPATSVLKTSSGRCTPRVTMRRFWGAPTSLMPLWLNIRNPWQARHSRGRRTLPWQALDHG